MDATRQKLVDSRIKAYLTKKVKETFPDDFYLIENRIAELVQRYSLKELILITRIEIDRIKREDIRPGF